MTAPALDTLSGLRIIVTRPQHQSAPLIERLSELGAEPVAFPTIEVVPPTDGGAGLASAAARIEDYEWVVLTSTNGVDSLAAALDSTSPAAAARLESVRIAAIGPATAAAIEASFRRRPNLVPPAFVAESLLEVFPKPSGSERLVLIARAEIARPVLPEGLAAAGWDVDLVAGYRVRAASPDPSALDELRRADLITFTSPSTFQRYVELAESIPMPRVIACIGPITADAVRRAGLDVDVESSVHTAAGLVDAIVAWVGTEANRRR